MKNYPHKKFYEICLYFLKWEKIQNILPFSINNFHNTLFFRWWQVPYYWVGIKCYDLVAGLKNVKSSYLLSKKSALELFPMLRGDALCGALVYYDGTFGFLPLQL